MTYFCTKFILCMHSFKIFGMETIIKKRTTKTTLIDHKIVRTEYENNSISTASDVWDSYESYITLSQNNPFKKLIVIGKNAYFDIENHQCNMDRVNPIAEAFVFDSLPIRLTLLNCKRLIHSKHPWKMFKTEAEAINWLKSVG